MAEERERKPQLKAQGVPAVAQFRNENGEPRYNIYVTGMDGCIYRMVRDGKGWIRCNMDIIGTETPREREYDKEE